MLHETLSVLRRSVILQSQLVTLKGPKSFILSWSCSKTSFFFFFYLCHPLIITSPGGLTLSGYHHLGLIQSTLVLSRRLSCKLALLQAAVLGVVLRNRVYDDICQMSQDQFSGLRIPFIQRNLSQQLFLGKVA